MPSAPSDGGARDTVVVGMVIAGAAVLVLVCLGGGAALFLSMRATERDAVAATHAEAVAIAEDRAELVELAGSDPELPETREIVAELEVVGDTAEAVATEAILAATAGHDRSALQVYAVDDLDPEATTKLLADVAGDGEPSLETMATTTRGDDSFEALMILRRDDRVVKLRVTMAKTDEGWRMSAVESERLR